MTSNEILGADVLDILFQNRNKQYGAYALRRQYAQRMVLGLAIAFSTALLFFFLLLNWKNPTETLPEFIKTAYEVTAVKLPEPEPQEEKPAPARAAGSQAPVAQQKLVSRIAMMQDPTELPSTQTDLAQATIGTTTMDGPASGPGMMPLPTGGSGDGTDIKAPAAAQPEDKPFVAAERAAEFPGGPNAWIEFLRRNLDTPESLQAGETRTVLLRFRVSKEGEVTDFEVVRSAGAIFDREVIRVLRKMPRWKPASQNGHPVPVSFTQAVSFVGEEA